MGKGQGRKPPERGYSQAPRGQGGSSRKKPASYEDIEALPVGWIGEIVDEELVAQPRPAFGHQRAAWALGGQLYTPFDRGQGGPGGWWIFYEPELHFGQNVLVPDLAGWRRERMPQPPRPTAPFATSAPDWICEILSPSTATVDRARKLPIYHREGVCHAWVIDPLERTLEVFHRSRRGWMLAESHAGQSVVRAIPFESVALELSALWLPGSEIAYVP
ncbi:Uma2 family endonuclease [Hyalangium rubrum]|uniref:Uma2 family endonuclease n=1 Tax=Hyalangium rubrum TaxID=3103134 RepID=A0ABU5HC94_9BACT|nr:Uma2 family endonuclease [Hyalangium sp. s54d21]MDY7231078.1 Uma2 family endonuclease [Hyalangium sp. s54d21]